MRFVIVTGMSGAGITTALKILEDAGYFCVDNLPIPLMGKFIEFIPQLLASRGSYGNIALGVDARSGNFLDELEAVLDTMKETLSYEILFMDAADSALLKRYKETRRSHPMAMGGRIEDGIQMERQKLAFLKKRASYILDTSRLLTRDLRREIGEIFVKNSSFQNMMVTILSFGYKYGIPSDADLVFDVRFLPNPFYVDSLRPLTGNDEEVFQYVMHTQDAQMFSAQTSSLLSFLLPRYVQEGKTSLVIAVGCTGGKHRSVSVARELYARLSETSGYGFRLEHRDIGKDREIRSNF